MSGKIKWKCYVVKVMAVLVIYMQLVSSLKLMLPAPIVLSSQAALGTSNKTVEDDLVIEEPANLYAMSAVLMDGNSGRVLFEKEGTVPMPMASTTKIMTCIIALELGNLEDVIVVSSYAASMPEVNMNMRTGETYCLEDLLYSLMLESHNDSAVAIAEHIGGSVEGFAKLMNDKAEEIGCMDTYFITPNGLDDQVELVGENGLTIVQAHETTAVDLATIMMYCAKQSPQKDDFLEITRTPMYSFTSNGRSFSCMNHNSYLTTEETALSGKTGFTNAAGYCYVGIVEEENECYVVSLLACGWPNNKTYKWADMKELITYGYEMYEMGTLETVTEHDLEAIFIEQAQTERLNDEVWIVPQIRESNKQIELLKRLDEKFSVEILQEKTLVAPIESQTVVGSITYYLEDEVIGVDYLVVMESVEEIDFWWCFRQILKRGLV